MKIVHGVPPNFEDIKNEFNPSKNIVFSFGDILYSQDGRSIPPDLMIHEQVHGRQQNGKPLEWWDRYIKDVDFRLSQEIEAYREQFKFVKARVKDKNERARFLHYIASDLSSSLYGSIITYSEAIKKLK